MANWAKLQEDLTGLKVVKRAKHGIHFDKGDGQVLANFSGKPCHFLDGGLWKPIDTKLVKMWDGWYGSAHSDVRIHPDGQVKILRSDYQQFTKLPSAKTGVLSGDRIIRTFPGGEQHLIMKEDGFREEIHVFKPTFPLEKFIAGVTGSLPSKYTAHAVTAIDANENSYEFTGDVKAFGAWLDAAKYPVVIDPDFAGDTADGRIYGDNATYATARSTSSSVSTAATSYVLGQNTGFRIARHFYLFDTSSIGTGNTVTQVNLKFTVTNTADSATDFDVQIVKQNWQTPLGTYREDNYDGCLAGTADDAILGNTASMSDGNTYTSGNLSTAWVNRTGTTYYSLRSSRDYAGTEPTESERITIFFSNEATESRRPVLTVTYAASGTFIPINMNSQFQNLAGGIRG